MSTNHKYHWAPILFGGLIALAALLTAVTHNTLQSFAQEASDAVATDDAAEAAGDPLAIPEGGPKELLDFIGEVGQLPVEGETPEEQEAYRLRAIQTMEQAAEMVLAADPTNRQALDAHHYRLETLQALVMLGEEGAAARLDAAIDEAKSDPREPIAAAGWSAHLTQLFHGWDDLDDAGKEDVKNNILDAIRSGKPSRLQVSIVSSAANALADVDDAFAADLLEEAVPLLKEKKDKKVNAALADANIEGVLRRLRLPGNQMDISGTLLNGDKVDWNSYRGKVVLVDFWATWCGPCREEVPNVLAMYKAYHDKGFDVLGVSLDATEAEANSYVEENDIPWPSIFPQSKKDRAWNHPLVKHYGIMGIPTAILVDKEGKVVHMNARGGYLRRELERLLGEPGPGGDEGEQAGGQ